MTLIYLHSCINGQLDIYLCWQNYKHTSHIPEGGENVYNTTYYNLCINTPIWPLHRETNGLNRELNFNKYLHIHTR